MDYKYVEELVKRPLTDSEKMSLITFAFDPVSIIHETVPRFNQLSIMDISQRR